MEARVQVVIILLLLLLVTDVHAERNLRSLVTSSDKTTLSIIADPKSSTASSDPVLGAQRFIEQHADSLRIKAPSEQLALKLLVKDSLETSHVRYRQQLDNLPVWGSELAVHLDRRGRVTSVTGSISELGVVSTTPKLSEATAITQAKADWVAEFGSDDGVPTGARLFIVDPLLIDKRDNSKLRLAWKVTLISHSAPRSFEYLVDAHSGEVFGKYSRIKNLSRAVFDCSFGDGFCRLDQFVFNYVFGRSEGQPDRGENPIYNTDRLDTDFIYYRIGAAHFYFQNLFGRDGANFAGGIGVTPSTAAFTPAASYAEDATNHDQFKIGFCPNANWDPDRERLSFCKGMPTLDIVGHEYTHAVAHFSILDEFGQPNGLNFVNEAGSLAEGFSDVFGEAIERFAYGSNDWMMGSSQGVVTPIMRNISNPESMGLPSTMYSPAYFCGTDDSGGIHTNNVVLAHAAYRLANGGDLSGCSIQAIGPEKQEAIFYRALTTYVSPSSGYAAAYTALINACTDLFGDSSPECLQTKRTVNAVMMNQPGRCSGVPAAPVDCLDPTDLCPTNPNKRSPGACGCIDEVDQDGNGAFDCLVAAEFKADLNLLSQRLGSLTRTPKSRAKKAALALIKSDIRRLLNELENAATQSAAQIQLNSTNQALTNLLSSLKKAVNKALKTGAANFPRNRAKARQSASKFIGALA